MQIVAKPMLRRQKLAFQSLKLQFELARDFSTPIDSNELDFENVEEEIKACDEMINACDNELNYK